MWLFAVSTRCSLVQKREKIKKNFEPIQKVFIFAKSLKRFKY